MLNHFFLDSVDFRWWHIIQPSSLEEQPFWCAKLQAPIEWVLIGFVYINWCFSIKFLNLHTRFFHVLVKSAQFRIPGSQVHSSNPISESIFYSTQAYFWVLTVLECRILPLFRAARADDSVRTSTIVLHSRTTSTQGNGHCRTWIY